MISVFYLYHNYSQSDRGAWTCCSVLRRRKLSEYPVSNSALILLWNFVLYVICRFKLCKYVHNNNDNTKILISIVSPSRKAALH